MTETPPIEAQPRVPWRRLTLFSLLFLGLTAAGLYVVYDQFAGRSVSFDHRLIQPTSVAAILALLLVYFSADGLRLYFTLRALGHRLPLATMLRLVFINIFVSNVTPMATGGGVAQVWFLQRHGVPIGRATAATTIRTVLAIVFIFSLTPAFLLTLPALQDQPILDKVSVALSFFIVIYLGFFAVVLLRAHWLIPPLSTGLAMLRRLHLISAKRHRRWQFKARREMLRFSLSFGHYVRGPRASVLLSVVFTGVFLLSLFSFPALLIYSLGYDEVQYLTTVGLLVVTTFIMYFSPTPGASGISEGVFGTFFRDILTANHLVLVILAWRLLTIYLGMLVGLVILQQELARTHKDPK
ncbi:MAG: lysylphosphatidylglycerol synthase transmembrane domain-containing protein [Marinobacter sp.]|uniref:lysylphosphatidylglycerol synthase transmembrane domain-containing protein n=1 Tax=Marinobacter sp. TaxID=50741 RepID=UPI00299EE713|nr:lysylphosphatidylglycerol synthase transmembrane domain-containing protein [Marinobacter sp.]MDX1634677.1 lysylphosphatidylglycerol synthase transmembrane domain-containing protein [Marinobacter sp.]